MVLKPTINVALFKLLRKGNPKHDDSAKIDASINTNICLSFYAVFKIK